MKSIDEIYEDIKSRYSTGGPGSLAEEAQVVLEMSDRQRSGHLTNWFENKLIDFIFRNQAYTPPPNLYIGLYSAAITDNAEAEELSGEGYARAVIPRSLLAWSGTQGTGSTGPSSGDSGLLSNNAAIQFPVAQSEWGTALWYAVLDAPAGGNMLFYGELLYPRTIYPGDTPITFLPGDMTIWIT